MRNPALAETLQNIADHGADVLYRGPIAEKIVAAVSSFHEKGYVALWEFRWALLGSPLQGIRTIYFIFYLSNIFSLQNLNWEFIYLFIFFFMSSV